MATEILRPNAAGYYSQWSAAGDSPNYACVDESSADGDTTYCQLVFGNNGRDSYNLGAWPYSGKTINSVTVYFTARTSASKHILPFLRLSSTDNDGTGVVVGATYAQYSETIARPGGGDWSEADLANLEAGCYLYDNSGKAYGRVTQVYVVVDYSDAGGGDVSVDLSGASGVNAVADGSDPSDIIHGPISYAAGSGVAIASAVDPFLYWGSCSITPDAVSASAGSAGCNVSGDDIIFEYLYPTGDGDETDWSANGAANAYDCVDDDKDTPNDNTDYISHNYASTSDYTHLFELSDLSVIDSEDSIANVDVFVRARRTAPATTSPAKVVLKLGGNTSTSDAFNLSYSWDIDEVSFTASRPGGGSWSYSDFASLQAGLQITGHGSTTDYARCTSIYVRVHAVSPVKVSPSPATAVASTEDPYSIKTDWPDIDYAFRREITFGTDHSGYSADDVIKFDVESGLREIVADDAVTITSYAIVHRKGKTHIAYLTRIDQGDVMHINVVTKNHATGEYTDPVKIDDAKTATDTHNAPVICADNDDILHVFYGCHGSPCYHARSTNANDSSSWTLKGQISATTLTYPVGFVTPSDNRLYLFARRGQTYKLQITIFYSDDAGDTWSSYNDLIDYTAGGSISEGDFVYAYGCRLDENERLHVGFSFVDNNTTQGVWYTYSDYTGSGVGFTTWKDISGSTIGTTSADPIDFDSGSDSAIVIDNHANDDWRYFCQTMSLDASNNPVLLWTQESPNDPPNVPQAFGCSYYADSSWHHYRFTEEFNIQSTLFPGQVDINGVLRQFPAVKQRRRLRFIPDADGAHTDVLRSAGSDNYALVDDGRYNHDSSSTYVHLNTASGAATFTSSETIGSFVGEDVVDFGQVLAVGVEMFGITYDANEVLKATVRISGVDYDETVSGFDLDSYYSRREYLWDYNPATSLPWTVAEAEAAEFGFKDTAGGICRVTSVVKVVDFHVGVDDQFGSYDILQLSSDDGGETWGLGVISANSEPADPGVVVPMSLDGGDIEMAWKVGSNIFLYSPEKYGKIRNDGRDLRVYHGSTEIHRLLDYPASADATITIKLPEAIASGQERGSNKLWLVYGNPSVAESPLSDPTEIYQWGYDGAETYDEGEDLDGVNNWSSNATSLTAYHTPPNASNAVYEGRAAINAVTNGSDLELDFTQPSVRTTLYAEAAIWMQAGGTDLYVAMVDDSVDENFAAIGMYRTWYIGKTYVGNVSGYDFTNYNDIHCGMQTIVIYAIEVDGDSSTYSAWINGELVTENEACDLSNIEKIRIVTFDAGSGSETFIDSFKVCPRRLVNVVTLGDEEIHGAYVGAVIVGQNQDQIEVSASVDTEGDATGQLTADAEVSAPSVVLSSIAIAPATISAVASVSDPTVATGPIVVSPAVVDSVATVVAPDLVFGSVVIDTGNVAALAGAVDPSVVLGSISVAPDDLSVIASTVSPNLVFGSVAFSPGSVSAHADVVNPSIELASISYDAGAVGAVAAATDPTVVLGGISITPDSLTAVANIVNPGVVQASMSIGVGSVSAIAGIVVPVVTQASMSVSVGAVVAIADVVNPSIELGDISIAPDVATAIAGITQPTVVQGSISIAAEVVAAVADVASPAVLSGDALISPSFLSAVASVVVPTVELGGILIGVEPATAVADISQPSYIQGSISVLPSSGSSVATVVPLSVLYGDVAISPSTVVAVASSVPPTIVLGDMLVVVGAVVAVANVTKPSFVYGSLVSAPSHASAVASTSGCNVLYGSTYASPSELSSVATGVDPSVALGSIFITPGTVSAIADTVSPSLYFSSSVLAPDVVSAIAATLLGSIAGGTIDITPTAVIAAAATVAPTVLYGSDSVDAGNVIAVANVVDPSVVLGDIVAAPSVVVAIASTLIGSILFGSVAVSPSHVESIANVVDPEISLGELVVSPSFSSALASVVVGDIVFGSSVVDVGYVSAAASATASVLGGTVDIEPSHTDALASVSGPIVVFGSVSTSPSAVEAAAGSVTGDIVAGDINISPVPVAAVAGVVAPSVVFSSVAVSPNAVDAAASTSGPSVGVGQVLVTPSAATAVAGVASPSVVFGDVSVGGTTVTAAAGVVAPSILLSSVVVTTATVESAALTSGPSIGIGQATVTPDAVTASIDVAQPDVILGGVSVSVQYVDAVASTVVPTIGTIVVPSAVSAVAGAVDPDLLFGSVSVSVGAQSVASGTVDPVVILGSLSLLPAQLSVLGLTSGPSAISVLGRVALYISDFAMTYPVLAEAEVLFPSLSGFSADFGVITPSVLYPTLSGFGISEANLSDLGTEGQN